MASDYAQLRNLAAVTSQLETILGTWGDAEPWAVEVGAPYGGFVEFGTVHMSAQPYMRPAIDQTGAQVGDFVARADSSDQVVSELAQEIAREASRMAPVDTGQLQNSISARRQ